MSPLSAEETGPLPALRATSPEGGGKGAPLGGAGCPKGRLRGGSRPQFFLAAGPPSASLCSAPPPKGEALLRCRTTFPVEWCGAPGGFGIRPYEVRIGVAVVRQGPGNAAPARWNGIVRHRKMPHSSFPIPKFLPPGIDCVLAKDW